MAKVTEQFSIIPVSVVIPCFNCAMTIGRAVQSILQQTGMPMEIILVDDASKDESFSILEELVRKNFGLVQALHLDENAGAGSARNAGWALATQPYIAFLDADDSWHVDKLRIQYEYMRANPAVTLSGHQCAMLEDAHLAPKVDEDYLVSEISSHSLLLKNAFSTPTTMLKRSIPFRFEEGKRHAEDLLLWQQIAFAGLLVTRLESPLAYVHKPLYGVSGLSANLWEMEKGELSNFVILYRSGRIGELSYFGATLFSLAKFARRLIISSLRALGKKYPKGGR